METTANAFIEIIGTLVMLALFFALIASAWFFLIKSFVMPPCSMCSHSSKTIGGNLVCDSVCDRVDGKPEFCDFARHNPRCKFEKRASDGD